MRYVNEKPKIEKYIREIDQKISRIRETYFEEI